MTLNLPTTLKEALKLIQHLFAENHQLKQLVLHYQEEIQNYQKEIQSLKDEVNNLKIQIGKNSTNSSKPPSTDQKRNTLKEGKHGGAKKGHRGTFRLLFAKEQVTNKQQLFAQSCPRCGSKNLISERKPLIHQVIDLPQIKPEVTEYRLELCRCMSCGKHVRATLPLGISKSMIGPRLTAWIGLLSCQLSLSLRKIKTLIKELLQQSFSPGTIFACQQRISKAIKESYEEVKTECRKEAWIGADETGWRTHGKRRWVWIMTGKTATLLEITSSRSRKCAQAMLGKNTKQPLVTDRYQVYSSQGPHQYCLAHWKRNIEELKNFSEGENLYQFLSQKINKVFSLWHRYQRKKISWVGFRRATTCLKHQIQNRLKYEARAGPTQEIRSFCNNSLRNYHCFWTFTVVKGMEPTNNRAERELRPIVIRRKICLGTKSRRGEEFLERIYSIFQTAFKRGIDVWNYLKEALICDWSGQSPPSLKACV